MDRRFMLKAASLVILGKLVKVPTIVHPNTLDKDLLQTLFNPGLREDFKIIYKQFEVGFRLTHQLIEDDFIGANIENITFEAAEQRKEKLSAYYNDILTSTYKV